MLLLINHHYHHPQESQQQHFIFDFPAELKSDVSSTASPIIQQQQQQQQQHQQPQPQPQPQQEEQHATLTPASPKTVYYPIVAPQERAL
jgi:hypothetical protein